MSSIRFTRLFATVCVTAASSIALAQHEGHPNHAQASAPSPINAMCPVGKEPIESSAGTVEYKGKTIGLCCPGCGEEFLAWDEARKDEFVALAVAHREPGTAHAQPVGDDDAKTWTDPYPLGTCPISDEKLGSMGEPVVKKYDGREVRFCCPACIKKFEADLDASWKKVDEAIVKDQLRYYPAEKCVVSSEALTEDGEDIAVNFVYGNRLFRLCCNMCKSKFRADSKKFIEALDKATIEAQRKDYPLETCPVSGKKLGSMGDPLDIVVAGRLLRLCCPMCKPKVEADPTKYLSVIDKAWQAKGKFMPHEAHGHDERGEHGAEGGHGDHDHGG